MMKGEDVDKVIHSSTERYDLIADKWETNVFFTIKSKAFIKIQSFVNLKNKNQLKQEQYSLWIIQRYIG